jgi:uncharacterized membrane protein YeaQ/YmgE (transglycosylase-associated protein family)
MSSHCKRNRLHALQVTLPEAAFDLNRSKTGGGGPNKLQVSFERAHLRPRAARRRVMFCSLVGWAIFGLLVGGIARLAWPGRQAFGALGTLILGVAGSIVGGLLTYLLRGGPAHHYHPAGLLMSIVGAVVVLWFFSETKDRNLSS